MRRLTSVLLTSFALLNGSVWAQGNDGADQSLMPDDVIIIEQTPTDPADQATIEENAPATAENCMPCDDDEAGNQMDDETENEMDDDTGLQEEDEQ